MLNLFSPSFDRTLCLTKTVLPALAILCLTVPAQAEEGKLFRPEPGATYQLMECTKGEYVAADPNNNVLRWAPTRAIDQNWTFENKDGRLFIKSGKGKYLTVEGNGNVTIASPQSGSSQSFELYEIPDANALPYLPVFYLNQTLLTMGKKRAYTIVRIKEFTRNERVAVGSNGKILRWSPLNENSQVFLLWKFTPPVLGPSRDMQYSMTPKTMEKNPKFPYVWNPNSSGVATEGSFTRTIYSPLDGQPLMTYTSSKPPRDSDGCSIKDKSNDPGTQLYSSLFLNACMGHDLNYAAPWTEVKWTSVGQAVSDLVLRDDMGRIINGWSKGDFAQFPALAAANAWYTGLIAAFGKDAYENGQKANTNQKYVFTDIKKGEMLVVKNEGEFLLGVDVTYTDAIGRQIKFSDKRIKGTSSVIPLSIGAANITVDCYAVGGKVIFRQFYPTAKTEARIVSGLSVAPSVKMTTL